MKKSNYLSKFIKENTKKVNKIMYRTLWGFLGIGLLMGIMSFLGLFKMEPTLALKCLLIFFGIVIISSILKFTHVSDDFMKYYYIFILQFVILFLGMNEYVGLNCVFI